MENITAERVLLNQKVRNVQSHFMSLVMTQSNDETELGEALKEQLLGLQASIADFDSKDMMGMPVEVTINSALRVASDAKLVASTLKKFPFDRYPVAAPPNGLLDAAQELEQHCNTMSTGPTRLGLHTLGMGTPTVAAKVMSDEARLARLNAQVDEIKREFAAMEARFEALGTTADKAVVRVEELTVQQADAIRSEMNSQVASINEGFLSTSQALKDRMSEFEGYREQAKGLLEQMAVEVLADGHIGSAAKEERAANKFRWAAMGIMFVGAVAIGWIFYHYVDKTFTWSGFTNRITASLLFVVPAAYLARESDKHRAQAIELRRTSLDFAALVPFMKGIEGEEAVKLRSELARRAFFVSGPASATVSDGINPQAIIMKGMDTIAELAKRRP